MSRFIANILFNFFIAMGVMIGGCFFGAVAATIAGIPPLKTIMELSSRLKIWAVVVALGGTFSSFRALEAGILQGEILPVIKQFIYVTAALAGAHMGQILLTFWKEWVSR